MWKESGKNMDLENLPEDPVIYKKEAAVLFNTQVANIDHMIYTGNKTIGKLKTPGPGMIDLRWTANYILKRSRKGGNKLRRIALKIKAHYKETNNNPIELQEVNEEAGIEYALERIRQTEILLAKKVQEQMEDPVGMADTLRNWNQTLEILRKTEVDTLKVLEEKKELIRMDEVKALYNKGIVPVKTRLLALPAQLSSILEGQDAATVQRILTSHLTKVLEDASRIWEEEDD